MEDKELVSFGLVDDKGKLTNARVVQARNLKNAAEGTTNYN